MPMRIVDISFLFQTRPTVKTNNGWRKECMTNNDGLFDIMEKNISIAS